MRFNFALHILKRIYEKMMNNCLVKVGRGCIIWTFLYGTVAALLTFVGMRVAIDDIEPILQIGTKQELELNYKKRIGHEEWILNQDRSYNVVYIKINTICSLLCLSSGSPIMIFDDKGIKVDSSWDSGDDPKFMSKWLHKVSSNELERARK